MMMYCSHGLHVKGLPMGREPYKFAKRGVEWLFFSMFPHSTMKKSTYRALE